MAMDMYGMGGFGQGRMQPFPQKQMPQGGQAGRMQPFPQRPMRPDVSGGGRMAPFSGGLGGAPVQLNPLQNMQQGFGGMNPQAGGMLGGMNPMIAQWLELMRGSGIPQRPMMPMRPMGFGGGMGGSPFGGGSLY